MTQDIAKVKNKKKRKKKKEEEKRKEKKEIDYKTIGILHVSHILGSILSLLYI